jgi:hypothetical protein
MRRLRYEMQHAARHGRVYHLWFHPEDVGADTDRNYSFLEKVFEGFADLREEGAMESLNMQEFFHRFEESTRQGGRALSACLGPEVVREDTVP